MKVNIFQKRYFAIIAAVSLAVLVLVGIRASLSAAAQAAPYIPSTGQPFIKEQGQPIKIAQAYTAQASGYRMQASQISISTGQVAFKLCFEVPFKGDWAADKLALVVGQKEYTESSGLFLDGMVTIDGVQMQCTLNKIPVPEGVAISDFGLRVERISTSAPEQPDCVAAQKKLDEAGSGIKFSCRHDEWSFGFDITEKPAALTDVEARQVVADSFKDVVNGPWMFEIKP